MFFKTLMFMSYCLVVIYIEFNISINSFSQSNCCYNVVIEKAILKQSQYSSSNSLTNKSSLFGNIITAAPNCIFKISTIRDKCGNNFNLREKILFKSYRIQCVFIGCIHSYNKLSNVFIQKHIIRSFVIGKSDLVPMKC